MPCLLQVQLKGNAIGDEGAQYLAAAMHKNTTMRVLPNLAHELLLNCATAATFMRSAQICETYPSYHSKWPDAIFKTNNVSRQSFGPWSTQFGIQKLANFCAPNGQIWGQSRQIGCEAGFRWARNSPYARSSYDSKGSGTCGPFLAPNLAIIVAPGKENYLHLGGYKMAQNGPGSFSEKTSFAPNQFARPNCTVLAACLGRSQVWKPPKVGGCQGKRCPWNRSSDRRV